MDRRALLQSLPTIALIPAAVWAGAEPGPGRGIGINGL